MVMYAVSWMLLVLGIVVTPATAVYGEPPPGDEFCEDGWMEFSLDTGNDTICLQFNTEGRSWPDAERHCAENIANLVQLDIINQYSTLTGQEITMFVADVLVETLKVKEFWSGMHVQNGRLMWDDNGPQYVISPTFDPVWNWAEYQPDPSVGACGKVTAGTTSTNTSEVYSKRMTVSLKDCASKLVYICQKNPVKAVLKTSSFCDDNWIGNQFLPNCFRIFKNAVSYADAIHECTDNKGRLAVAKTFKESAFVEKAFDFYQQTDEYFSTKQVDQLWVNYSNPVSDCALFYKSRQSVAPVTNCTIPNLFICSKPTRHLGFGRFEFEGPFLDPDLLLDYPPFAELPLVGKLDRTLNEGEIQFVQTPTMILNSTNNYQQTFIPGVPWVPYRISQTDVKVAPFYVTVTLGVRDGKGSPARRKRQLDNRFLDIPAVDNRFLDFDFIQRSTGYYSYGVYNINPPVPYNAGPPILVRYSEADLFIYVLYLKMNPDLETGRLPVRPEDMHSFNLMRDENVIRSLASAAYCIIQSCEDEVNRVTRIWTQYAGNIELISNDTVKFRLFVGLTSSRQVPTVELDQTVFHAVKRKVLDNIAGGEGNLVSFSFWDNSSVDVRSTIACPRYKITVDRTLLTFPATRIGERRYSWERCFPDNKARAIADCEGSYDTGAVWGNIHLTPACVTVPEYNQSTSTQNLQNLSKTTMDEDNYVDILRNTVTLTLPDVNVNEADVIYTADILSNYVDTNFKSNHFVLSSVFKITNNILFTDRRAIDNAQKITNAANRIVKSVDDLTSRIEFPPLVDRNNESVTFVEDYIASEVWLQNGDGPVMIGISVDSDSDKKIKRDSLTALGAEPEGQFNETDVTIYLTKNLVQGFLTKLAFHVYSRTYLFSDSSDRYVVKSSIAAATLIKNNRAVRNLGNEYVTAVFHITEGHADLVCAYWDYTANEAAGGWRTDGCNLTQADVDGDIIICKCNHLTNFAVLVDLEANTELSETDKLVLGIITKVGLILSIIGLGLTILTFLIFKHLRNGRGQQVLVNLSVSMLCSAILFLVGIDRTSSYGGCIAVAVLLHYFILVSFMWMLVEGVLQYLRFVKVLGTYIPNFMLKSMIPAWGIPLIPVIVILAVDYDMYYGGKGYCWLSRIPMIYAFIIPVGVIILSNIVVFTMVMCNLCRRKNKNMASNQSERKMAFLHFQAAVSIFVILGLTWVFGFLTVDDTRIAFHYLFAIFNAFQGLFVFLLFTAREKQIQNAWRKLCCGRSPYKSTTSSSDDARRKHSNGDSNSTALSKSDKNASLEISRSR